MTEFTQAGKEMANRIFTNQGPRYGLGIERLCTELGELRARVEALESGLTTVSLELRDRVEALEAAQRAIAKDSLTVPADSLAGRRRRAAMKFRGVMFLPPPDCADPDFWIAERIYEMGLADGKSATTGNTASVTRDREEARAAILAVADWFEQQGWPITTSRLRQEVE